MIVIVDGKEIEVMPDMVVVISCDKDDKARIAVYR
jgi:hypothetical protein